MAGEARYLWNRSFLWREASMSDHQQPFEWEPLPEPLSTEPLLELRMTFLGVRPAEAANGDPEPAHVPRGTVTLDD
jgi:hypothetical protein